jgi:hypothetical protein
MAETMVFFTSPTYNHMGTPIAAKNITEHIARMKLSSALENKYKRTPKEPSIALKKGATKLWEK